MSYLILLGARGICINEIVVLVWESRASETKCYQGHRAGGRCFLESIHTTLAVLSIPAFGGNVLGQIGEAGHCLSRPLPRSGMDSWAVTANNRKFRWDVPDHQVKHLHVTEKSAFKDETEQLLNLSASGKGNGCFFSLELKIAARESRTYNSGAGNRQKHLVRAARLLLWVAAPRPQLHPGPLTRSRPSRSSRPLSSKHVGTWKGSTK